MLGNFYLLQTPFFKFLQRAVADVMFVYLLTVLPIEGPPTAHHTYLLVWAASKAPLPRRRARPLFERGGADLG